MRIKTFYAKSMADAMYEIKAALGPEALLLSTREIRRRSGMGGPVSGFEVVAACDDSANTSTDVSPLLDEPGDASVLPSRLQEPSVNSRFVRSLRRTNAIGQSADDATPAVLPGSPVPDALSAGLYQDLLASGVEEWLTRKLLLDATDLLGPAERNSRSALMHAAGQATRRFLPGADSFEGFPGKRVVAFVGPTGVGKTTSLAKLAARLALKERKKVVLITLDAYRIGAVEQARTYAGLIGIPFRFISQVEDLPQVVQEYGTRDYVLIDTAGRSPRDQDAIRFTADCLHGLGPIERHLVLSATTKSSDIQDIVERFRPCRPDHLLFTKLDETATLGPILNEVVRTGKPLSYYSDGQRVPEDFHRVPPEQLIQMVLQEN